MANGLDINRIARNNPLYAKLDDKLEKLDLTEKEACNLFWFMFGASFDDNEYLKKLQYRLTQLENDRIKQ
jgi:hypothetical protein